MAKKPISQKVQELDEAIKKKREKLEKYADERFSKPGNAQVTQKKMDNLREEIQNLEEEQEKMEVLLKVEESVELARAYIPLGKAIIDGSKGEVIDIIKLLMSIGIEVRKGLKDELEDISKLNAEAKMRDFKNLTTAGFDEEQAFKIVLATIKPVNFAEILQNINKKLQENPQKKF